MQKFPRVTTGMNALESEFLEYQATPDDEFSAYFDEDDKPMCTDHIWHKVYTQIDPYSGQPRFKHLPELAKFLLLIGRHNLGKDAAQCCHMLPLVYTSKQHL